MIRPVLGAMGLILICSRASADLSTEANKPYRLQVVLRMAEHPLFTAVFQDKVKRELHDSLQAALGDLAKVEVMRDHPRLQEVEAKGLKHALDGWNFIADSKIHFVLIDFVDGRYEIQARQYDGTAGLASSVVRQAATVDPHLVARSAGLLIDKDFGIVGTITQKDEKKVEVVFKGGGLGGPLSRWIKRDDIFAVAQIVDQANGGQSAFRVPFTLLQAVEDPKNGKCSCLIHHRFDDPLPDAAGVLGYRSLKLGTIKGPLRLRVVSDDKLGTPLPARRVQISAHGFQEDALEKPSTNSQGVVTSAVPYDGIAFVKVFEGGTPLAKIPIEIVDERTVTVPVSANPQAERLGQLILRRDRWLWRIFEALEVATSVIKDLNGKVEQSREDAMKTAQAGLKGLETDIKNLSAERDSLTNEAKQARAVLDVDEGEQRIKDLQEQARHLQTYIGQLTDVIKEENDPKKRKWIELAGQAKLLEAAADYDQAINLYEQIFAAGYEDAKLRAYVDKLKHLWDVKDEKHRKAHKFISEAWPAAQTAAQMKPLLAQAHEAFEACKAAGDWLRSRKLYRLNASHGSQLAKEFNSLKQDSEDDRKSLDVIDAVLKDLKTLNDEIEKYIKQTEPAKS